MEWKWKLSLINGNNEKFPTWHNYSVPQNWMHVVLWLSFPMTVDSPSSKRLGEYLCYINIMSLSLQKKKNNTKFYFRTEKILCNNFTRVGWKAHRLTKKELCHSNETWHALNSTFPDTNCIVSFQINPHWISNSGLWKVVLETFRGQPKKLTKGVFLTHPPS